MGEVPAPAAPVKPVAALVEPYGALIAPTAEQACAAELARTALETDVPGHGLPVPIGVARLDLDPDFVLGGFGRWPRRLSSLMSGSPQGVDAGVLARGSFQPKSDRRLLSPPTGSRRWIDAQAWSLVFNMGRSFWSYCGISVQYAFLPKLNSQGSCSRCSSHASISGRDRTCLYTTLQQIADRGVRGLLFDRRDDEERFAIAADRRRGSFELRRPVRPFAVLFRLA
jgi:hypothetical protein